MGFTIVAVLASNAILPALPGSALPPRTTSVPVASAIRFSERGLSETLKKQTRCPRA